MANIRDVGRLAQVSIGTVSNALNAPHRVSDDTLHRVLAAVEQLGYRPNRAARSLAGSRTHLLGYQLPDSPTTTDPPLDAFLHHLVSSASDHGLELVLFAPSSGRDEVEVYRDLILRGAVDGFVLSGTNYEDSRIEFLLDEGFPFVAFGRAADAHRFPWVDVDGAAGTAATVEHLVGLGHRRIGAVAWPEGSESGDSRLEGYRTAMEAAGLSPQPVVRAENRVAEGRAAYRRLLAEDPSLTAVICIQDTLALGLMMEAAADGAEIGADLAVAGFDDTPIAPLASPPLTSVRQPFEDVGRALIEMLVAHLERDGADPEGVLLTPVLIPRASTEGPDA